MPLVSPPKFDKAMLVRHNVAIGLIHATDVAERETEDLSVAFDRSCACLTPQEQKSPLSGVA